MLARRSLGVSRSIGIARKHLGTSFNDIPAECERN